VPHWHRLLCALPRTTIYYYLFITTYCLYLLLHVSYYCVELIYLLLFIISCLQRQHAGGALRQHDAGHYLLFIVYCLSSVYSGSMQEASCDSMIPAIIHLLFIHHLLSIYLFIRYSVPSAAACRRRPAAA
jgi:hypothetical protein